MRQAITTKYIGPTNLTGPRYKAFCAAGSITIAESGNLNRDDNHILVAKRLATKLGWYGFWHGGTTKDGNSVFVCADSGMRGDFTIPKQERA